MYSVASKVLKLTEKRMIEGTTMKITKPPASKAFVRRCITEELYSVRKVLSTSQLTQWQSFYEKTKEKEISQPKQSSTQDKMERLEGDDNAPLVQSNAVRRRPSRLRKVLLSFGIVVILLVGIILFSVSWRTLEPTEWGLVCISSILSVATSKKNCLNQFHSLTIPFLLIFSGL